MRQTNKGALMFFDPMVLLASFAVVLAMVIRFRAVQSQVNRFVIAGVMESYRKNIENGSAEWAADAHSDLRTRIVRSRGARYIAQPVTLITSALAFPLAGYIASQQPWIALEGPAFYVYGSIALGFALCTTFFLLEVAMNPRITRALSAIDVRAPVRESRQQPSVQSTASDEPKNTDDIRRLLDGIGIKRQNVAN